MARGWVYVISNKAMPDLVKIGYSERDPVYRASELKTGTGIPHSYEVVYDVLVKAPQALERLIHKALEEERENKEWFNCGWSEAVQIVRRGAHESGGFLCEKEYEVFNEYKKRQARKERAAEREKLRQKRKDKEGPEAKKAEKQPRRRTSYIQPKSVSSVLCPECDGLIKTAGKLPPYVCSRCGYRVQ